MSARKKVLIVDDDPALRALSVAVFEDEYEVMEAVDGRDGWEKALEWRPDLVVTDLMMPVMHGYELCSLLKGPKGFNVKIIVASSKPFPTDRYQARVAGADEYIVKPFKVEELALMARRLLDEGTAAAARTASAEAGESVHGEAFRSVPTGRARGPVCVSFRGTRGSCPTGGLKAVRYGANTSCLELRIGGVPVILDCGTGLRELGLSLSKEFADRPVEGHIFVSHTHWDHIQGFPFFVPFYNPRNKFKIYSVHGASSSLHGIFSGSMSLDYFPIPLSSLVCGMNFVELTEPVDIGVARVSFHHLNHPGLCIGFRIETGDKVVTCLSDHETFHRLGGDNEVSRRQDAELAEFAANSDLLVMEAQYTEEEYLSRKGWGHSTYDDVVRFGMASGAKSLAITHHDPEHDDEVLDRHQDYCRSLVAAEGSSMECYFARDGLCVTLA